MSNLTPKPFLVHICTQIGLRFFMWASLHSYDIHSLCMYGKVIRSGYLQIDSTQIEALFE